MNIRIAICLVMLLPASQLMAQDDLIPFRKGDKWGFAKKNKQLVIPAIYDSAVLFYEGMAGVRQGRKWGYVDTRGNLVIEPAWNVPYAFRNGKALAEKDLSGVRLYGLIDKTGKQVIPVKYNNIYRGSNNLLRITSNLQMALYNTEGIEIVPFGKYSSFTIPARGLLRVEDKRYFGFIDSTGKVISIPAWEKARDFQEGFAAVQSTAQYNTVVWTFIDSTGKPMRPSFNMVNNFSEGFASVQSTAGDWQLINAMGEYIQLPQTASMLGDIQNGVAAITVRGENGYRSGIVSNKGEMVAAPEWDQITRPSPHVFACRREGKWYPLDIAGKQLNTAGYDSIRASGNPDIVFVLSSGKWGTMHKSGRLPAPPKYDSIGFFAGDIWVVRSGDKYGYINAAGKELVPPRYQYAFTFNTSGIACYMMNNKCGFINSSGKEITPAKYDGRTLGEVIGNSSTVRAGYFFNANGLALVRLNGRWGYLGSDGTEYWEN